MEVQEYLCPSCEEEGVPDFCEDGLYHCSNCGHVCGDEHMKVTLRIEGPNKKVFDQMIDKTPIIRHERYGRIGWDYTILMIGGDRVGVMQHHRTNNPLHVELDLTTLMKTDEHWQTTLESLRVLR